MNDWLDNFTMMGIPLNEGEKSLMRYAMKKERERIIKLLQPYADCQSFNCGSLCECVQRSDWVIALIKGENK